MKGLPEERCLKLAFYTIETNATVRQTAKKFNVSKSTVHKDLTERLKTVNEKLFYQVRLVIQQNKAERHIRGGMATKRKYQRL